jgi:hypothetical protein
MPIIMKGIYKMDIKSFTNGVVKYHKKHGSAGVKNYLESEKVVEFLTSPKYKEPAGPIFRMFQAGELDASAAFLRLVQVLNEVQIEKASKQSNHQIFAKVIDDNGNTVIDELDNELEKGFSDYQEARQWTANKVHKLTVLYSGVIEDRRSERVITEPMTFSQADKIITSKLGGKPFMHQNKSSGGKWKPKSRAYNQHFSRG